MVSRRQLLVSLGAVALVAGAEPGDFTYDPAEPVRPLGDRLRRDFDRHLADPARWAERVKAETNGFPEGSLFGYALPLLGWLHVAHDDPDRARVHIGHLLELLVPETSARLGGGLADLEGTHGEGVWLGWLSIGLGAWRHLGGDSRWSPEHRRVNGALADAIEQRDGKPILSYPKLMWPFDTVPPLLGLALDDAGVGRERVARLTRAFLEWQDGAVDPDTGLPWSRLDPKTGAHLAGPRGCDLSLRIALLAQIDPVRAKALYEAYLKRFWLVRDGLRGFAEWTDGADLGADVDSGPIVGGFGTAATGFGLAATAAAGDTSRRAQLEIEVGMVSQVLPLVSDLVAKELPIEVDMKKWRTGFLFGDACLFAAATWRDLGLT